MTGVHIELSGHRRVICALGVERRQTKSGQSTRPYPLHGVHEVGQHHPEPLPADAPSPDLLVFIVGSAAQQPDAVLAMVAGYRGEFVQNPPFVLLGCLLVPVPDRVHKFLLRHLADAPAHVAASRVFGSILAEATTFLE